MTVLLTFPFEVLELINAYLTPRDIGVLSLTCRTFRDRLGPGNQYFWYRTLRKALGVSEHGHITPKGVDPGFNGFQKFEDGLFEMDYWKEASDLFSGRKTYACRYCLEADPPDVKNSERSLAFKSKGPVFGGDILQQFCQKCYRDWFTDLKIFAIGFPDFKVPKSIFHPVYGQSFIQIPSLIKLIETQTGKPYEVTRSPSSKFKAKWSASRGAEEAGYIDQALCLLRDSYRQNYRHLHIALDPNGYYNLLAYSLRREALDDRDTPGYPVVLFSEKVVQRIMDFIPLLKAGKKLAVADLVTAVNRLYLGDPDNFDITTLPHPDSVAIRRLLETLTTPKCAFHWILVYSRIYFESADNDVRCYWCLRSNGGKDSETNRFRYRTFNRKNPDDVPWITAHIIAHHSDMMWRRPRNKWVHDNFTFYSSHYGRSDVIVYKDNLPLPGREWERVKIRPDFVNEKLENTPVSYPAWCEGRVTGSDYFIM
ncbi:hypothetical protein TWF481_011345 [Arthrobotrys musiformis]|uniref:F-box domain-containing protein n=1 Tax=Arthrobotrys musiformis TaxID=47236 RepID=A0AAV9W120_9PEZI